MTIQQAWRVKRMMMFGTFVCAGIFLPFLPIRIPRICLFEKLLGIPCPGCGIYSSIVSLLRGNWLQSVMHNPMGPFVFFICAGLSIYFLYVVIRKTQISWVQEIYVIRLLNMITFSLLIIQWVYRLLDY